MVTKQRERRPSARGLPHKALHPGTLAAVEFTPAADLWVLEIQIRHPTRHFGAFFEDLLLE